MSRSQQQGVLTTAENNSGADQTAATDARTAETADIGSYQAQLAKFAAANPYTQGGQYDTAESRKLAGVADAGSAAITSRLQTQAGRTGQNPAGATATAAEVARANLRDLSTAGAGATQTRIADQAGYNDKVLGATEVPAQLEAGVYGTSVGAANGALNTAGGAAQTPGFWDDLGTSFAKSLGTTAGSGGTR